MSCTLRMKSGKMLPKKLLPHQRLVWILCENAGAAAARKQTNYRYEREVVAADAGIVAR